MGEPRSTEEGFAEGALAWLCDHEVLIRTAIVLRNADEQGALAALMSTRELTELRLAWEFLLSLDLGQEIERALAKAGIPEMLIEACCQALWGLGEPSTGLVAVSAGGLR
jgi:hypothetical protein